MIPKKHSSIYNEVSEELNLEVLLIEQLVEFYYKKIRFLLSELEEPRINIESLGHFTIKEKKVYKVIPHYKKLIDDHPVETFKDYHKKALLQKKLEQLIKVEGKILQEKERKKTFEDEKYIKTNLDKSQTDSGGDN